MKAQKIIFLVVIVLGVALFVFEHRKQSRAQMEMLSLRYQVQNLMAEKDSLTSQVERKESSSSMSENEMRELLRLRSEATQLRQKVRNFEQLHSAVTTPAPIISPSPATPTHVAFGTELRDMGAMTPERAASSLIWAVLNGRRDRLAELLELPANVSEAEASNHYDYFARSFSNSCLGKEFVSIQSVKPNSDGTLRLNQLYRDAATGKILPFPFMMRLTESGWKVVVESK
jgi:hypothetical protein